MFANRKPKNSNRMRKKLLDLNREAVKYFEDYFDYKFPFPKYDLVLIPSFRLAGWNMRERHFCGNLPLFSRPSRLPTITFRGQADLSRSGSSMVWRYRYDEWFDDLWLKEGFATFMAYKAMEKVLPEYDVWKVFYERTKQRAYLTDVTRGTTPIYQEIPNLSAAKSAYGNIVYNKAPAFLKQAEFYLSK